MHGLPAFGHYHGVYGLLIDKIEVPERHATDLVTALNFDIRAFDTLGEEFILFASVAGVALLLRKLRHEREAKRSRGIEDHRFAGASAGLQLASLYPDPAADRARLLHRGPRRADAGRRLSGRDRARGRAAGDPARRALLRDEAARARLDARGVEAIGAAGYAMIGVAGLIIAAVYLKNFLPLGTPACCCRRG